MSHTRHIEEEQAALYASGADFCRIFAEDMDNLYLLSLLLTADEEKAEQCFVSGLDDCANGNQVFKEWAKSWARRAVIKNAVRLIAPQATDTDEILSTISKGAKVPDRKLAESTLRAEMYAVLELAAFERFVLVMSVFEGYTDRECALLLGCTRESVIAARSRALQQFSSFVESRREVQTGLPMEQLKENRGSMFELPIAATA